MADIKILFVNDDNLYEGHSESEDSIKLLSLKTANFELTDEKLGNLVDGAEADDEHIHDARYYRENEHISISTGVSEAGLPIVLDAGGKLDGSFLDIEADLISFLQAPSQNTAEGDNLQELIDRLCPASATQKVDYNTDGTVDKVTVYKNSTQIAANRRLLHTFTYDAQLRVTTEVVDIFTFDDGTSIAKTTTFTYSYNTDGTLDTSTQATV
jgi:hypothetical protein